MNKMVKSRHTQRRRRFTFVVIVAILIATAVVSDILLYQHRLEQAGRTDIHVQESSEKAIEALGRLAVKERASREGYSRNVFSSGWAVVDGCDMRNRILQRDLIDTVIDENDNCTVLSGVLEDDPFTGKTIPFQRGRDTSGAIHIEHLVAVSDAWQKGAQELSSEQRHSFFNDPLNLVAVDGPANMQKGDKDASDWLPHKPYRCQYIARQIAVKLKYTLWVTKQEFNAMRRVLSTCPSQFLPLETEVG